MKIYVNHYCCEGGSSAGYGYYGSKRAAKKAAADWRRKDRTNIPPYDLVAQPGEVQLNKRGVLAALNRYGGHPDNG
jgi:hypothetical protein